MHASQALSAFLIDLLVFVFVCSDATLCALAASLMNSGQAQMRAAMRWLKKGFPFKACFEISHVTELASRNNGEFAYYNIALMFLALAWEHWVCSRAWASAGFSTMLAYTPNTTGTGWLSWGIFHS